MLKWECKHCGIAMSNEQLLRRDTLQCPNCLARMKEINEEEDEEELFGYQSSPYFFDGSPYFFDGRLPY